MNRGAQQQDNSGFTVPGYAKGGQHGLHNIKIELREVNTHCTLLSHKGNDLASEDVPDQRLELCGQRFEFGKEADPLGGKRGPRDDIASVIMADQPFRPQ